MRKGRWLELPKDYDYEVLSHPGKANILYDALSRKVNLEWKRVRQWFNDSRKDQGSLDNSSSRRCKERIMFENDVSV